MFTACNNFVMQSTVILLWNVTDICGSYSDMAHAVCGFLLTVARRRMTSIIIGVSTVITTVQVDAGCG